MAFSMHVQEGSVIRKHTKDQEDLALPFEAHSLLAVLFLFLFYFPRCIYIPILGLFVWTKQPKFEKKKGFGCCLCRCHGLVCL